MSPVGVRRGLRFTWTGTTWVTIRPLSSSQVWELLGSRYSLDHVTDALEKMQRYEDIKPIIVPSLG